MNDHKYSLIEIDEMRQALAQWCGADRNFPSDNVEEVLRTYMMNGSSAEEIIAHAKAQETKAWHQRYSDQEEALRSIDWIR